MARVRDLALLGASYHVRACRTSRSATTSHFRAIFRWPLQERPRASRCRHAAPNISTAHRDFEWLHGESIGTGLEIDSRIPGLAAYRPRQRADCRLESRAAGPRSRNSQGFGNGRNEDLIAIRVGLFSGNRKTRRHFRRAARRHGLDNAVAKRGDPSDPRAPRALAHSWCHTRRRDTR